MLISIFVIACVLCGYFGDAERYLSKQIRVLITYIDQRINHG